MSVKMKTNRKQRLPVNSVPWLSAERKGIGFMFKKGKTDERTALFTVILYLLIGSVVLLALCISLRGIMNLANRLDFIHARLDDYPRIHENFVEETDEWWSWWQTEDYQKRAEQGAFIYEYDMSHENDAEKLEYIRKTVGADEAAVIHAADYEPLHEKYHNSGLNTCFAELSDGRRLVLGIHGSLKQSRIEAYEERNQLLSQFEAGMPGYVVLLRDGELSIYENDETAEAVLASVQEILETGELNPETLKEKAKQSEKGTEFERHSAKIRTAGKLVEYAFTAAAYADNDDIMISAVEAEELLRFGRKRSWSLWFLCTSILLLMAVALWRTKLYCMEDRELESAKGLKASILRGLSALLMALLLVFLTVHFIQMLSNVNQSAKAAQDEAVYLKNVLKKEAERNDNIVAEFDAMYSSRANNAAIILSANPHLIDIDSLNTLNNALGASGLRVFDKDGVLLASDYLLRDSGDMKTPVYTAVLKDEDGNEVGMIDLKRSYSDLDQKRIYRSVLVDEEGSTTGVVELDVDQKQLDDLTEDTKMKEVIGDLHIIDTLHVVAVNTGKDQKIVAGTMPSWINDPAEKHGIVTKGFTDGYEGIVNFGGNKCYSVVFTYGDSWVVVGSEDVTPVVFFRGVILLFSAIGLVIAVMYLLLAKQIRNLQKKQFESGSPNYELLLEYPPIWRFIRGFMISVAILSIALFITTNGNPTSLTYNMVRGTWVRGISVVTVTTSVMLVSIVFAAQMLLDIAFGYLGRFLSPKGKTICGLIDSAVTYIGAIVVIIYTLTMFGINTTTLIGGVGATALVFTLGANSLIADVVAGLFIIFEGDFSVGDVVVINGWRGIVTEISIRTTKLMDDNTQDIRIVNNSEIKELINQSRENSTVIIDLPVSHSVGLRKGEEIIRQVLAELPQKFPKIIGTPQYWGISELPEKNAFNGKFKSNKARVAFQCHEKDKEMLTYEVYRYLVRTVNILMDDSSKIGTDDPALSEIDNVNEAIVRRTEAGMPADLDQVVAERNEQRKMKTDHPGEGQDDSDAE